MERTTRGGPPGGPGGAGGPGGGRGGPGGGRGGPGGFGGGGRGGPGGFGGGGRGGPGGGRGGPGGRDGDRRGPRRDDFGSRSDSLALDASRALDKPVLAGDFAAQLPVLEALAVGLQKARVRSPEAFGDDARGKLLTALLRVMHQRKVEDAEKEVLRRKVQATLGEVFRAVGDERRAGLCLAEAGEAKAAAHLLAHTGEWEAVAAAHERDGQFADAAKLYATHARPLDEARLCEKAGDHERALKLYLEAGAQEDAARAAKALPLPRAKVLLLQLGAGDLLLDRLAKEGRYEEIARLYERAGQWGDAGRAYEAAEKTFKAIACFDRGALAPEADRLIAAEAAKKLGHGDKVGAAAVWARFGRWAIAAREAPDPLHAHGWLIDAGEKDRANELARIQAEKATTEGLLADAAVWRERAGDLVAAAEAYAQGGKPGEGARCWELLHEWARAAPLWLEAGDRARAAELFARAGDHERAIGILKGG